MATLYFSRTLKKDNYSYFLVAKFIGWVMFFGSFAWGANRYIRGMIRSYEAYQIKEKYVLKQWNDNEGRWQHMRLRPSSAYKYIEVLKKKWNVYV